MRRLIARWRARRDAARHARAMADVREIVDTDEFLTAVQPDPALPRPRSYRR